MCAWPVIKPRPGSSSPHADRSLTDDFLATRIIEIVVHADDLSRSLPERDPVPLHRGALGRCVRALAAILAGQHPGRSVEVRIPPYAAVQCGHRRPRTDPHPRHPAERGGDRRRSRSCGWPPAASPGPTAMAAGLISASGLRADLSSVLPLLA